MSRALRIPMAFARWYWRRVKEFPLVVCSFAAGAAYASVLVTVPKVAFGIRPLLRWHGGKWILAPWIISHFPPHRVYVEPFGGAFSVGIRKPRAFAEVWNDLDDELVNLMRVLRREDLGLKLVEQLKLTPFARTEFIIDRLSGVVIEHRDAKATMAAHDTPETLHYVDPPYVLSTRSDTSKDYAVELSDDDHAELLEFLRSLAGTVILSGYPHPFYDGALGDWSRVERKHLADGARERTEVLWINRPYNLNLLGEAA
jgi:DNA adenine methylase